MDPVKAEFWRLAREYFRDNDIFNEFGGTEAEAALVTHLCAYRPNWKISAVIRMMTRIWCRRQRLLGRMTND